MVVLIILIVIIQTVINFRMLSIEEQGETHNKKVESSTPRQVTTKMYDRLQSRYITNTRVNSVFHPSKAAESSNLPA